MFSSLFASLMMLAQGGPHLGPHEAPDTIEQAIAQCEAREYASPNDAIKIAEDWLADGDRLEQQSRGLLLACLAWAKMQIGDMAEAREITARVTTLADSLTDPAERIALLERLASLNYRSGDAVAALQTIGTALELTEANGLDELLPRILSNLAIYLTEGKQYDSAIDHYERLLALPQEDGAEQSLLPVRYNFARTLMMDGQHERALEQLDRLIPLLQAPGLEPRLATALSMSGNASRRLGDLERARALTDQAAALHATFDNPAERSVLRRDQALLAREMGDLEAAEAYIREALALAEEIEFERIVLDAQVNLAEILEARGRYREALAVHQDYADRNVAFLEATQRSRLDALETELGMQRQAQELFELRQTSEVQRLQLAREALGRRVAIAALATVVLLAIALAVWQRRNQHRLLDASRTDSLTGLANRRYLTMQMQSAPGRPEDAVVLLVDLDHFKEINDAHGHDVGDRALIEVSRRLASLARAHDAICGRWGGEEFALYLPNATQQKALALAEAIRTGIAELEVKDHRQTTIALTASIGFTSAAGLVQAAGEEHWEPAMKVADELLYLAKHAGRNRALGVWPAGQDARISPLAIKDALTDGRLQSLELD
jgi:diguanylate cyclase (GGDEF)-like protein